MTITEMERGLERLKGEGATQDKILSYWNSCHEELQNMETLSDDDMKRFGRFTADVADAVRPDGVEVWALPYADMAAYGDTYPGMVAIQPERLAHMLRGGFGNLISRCTLYRLYETGAEAEMTDEDVKDLLLKSPQTLTADEYLYGFDNCQVCSLLSCREREQKENKIHAILINWDVSDESGADMELFPDITDAVAFLDWIAETKGRRWIRLEDYDIGEDEPHNEPRVIHSTRDDDAYVVISYDRHRLCGELYARIISYGTDRSLDGSFLKMPPAGKPRT